MTHAHSVEGNSHDEIQDLQDALYASARQADDTLKALCWVAGDGEQGLNYCPECVEVVVGELNANRRRKTIESDGGHDMAPACDLTPACDRCGCDLGYSLTNAGLEQELYNWTNSMPEAAIRPIDAYGIEAMLHAARYHHDSEVVDGVIKVARAAVALLPMPESAAA